MLQTLIDTLAENLYRLMVKYALTNEGIEKLTDRRIKRSTVDRIRHRLPSSYGLDVLDGLKTAKHLVFTRREELTTRIGQNDRRDFNRACEAISIDDFHWHDLRHTWASWHVQRGTPLMVLKDLGGWRTIEMVQKYAHLAPSHVAPHAETVTFLAQQRSLDAKTPLYEAAFSTASR